MSDKYRMWPQLEQVNPDSPRGLVWRAYEAEWCKHRQQDVGNTLKEQWHSRARNARSN